MDDVADALDAGHPLPLLGLVSSFLTVFEDGRTPLEPREPGLPSLDELLQSFFAADLPETSALLAGIAGLSGDEVLRSQVRREVAARGHVLPRWLAQLDRSSATDRAVQMRHVLGDGDDLMFGVRFPDGSDASVVVYVDHNLGTLVKDAFIAPGSLPELVETMRMAVDDPDTTLEDIDPADARARIAEAIELGAMTYPPLESDTCRPAAPSSSGPWACCRPAARGTGVRSGAPRTRRRWPSASSRRLTVLDWTTPTCGRCWTPCCGSAPTTAPATRCAGAPWPSRSCWPTGSPAKSWPTRPSCPGPRSYCGPSSASATPSAASARS